MDKSSIDLARMRKSYEQAALDEAHVQAHPSALHLRFVQALRGPVILVGRPVRP